jgi:hypothetical protein
MVVNSHPLYRLSYWGMKKELFNTVGAPSQYFIELEYFSAGHLASHLCEMGLFFCMTAFSQLKDL